MVATRIRLTNGIAQQRPENIAIEEINIRGLLSFGPDGIGAEGSGLELRPLNIIIGTNASGKSNFLDAIALLQATARDLTKPFAEMKEEVGVWLWKGKIKASTARIRAIVRNAKGAAAVGNDWLRYWLQFSEGKQHELTVIDEGLENKLPALGYQHPFQHFYVDDKGVPWIGKRAGNGPKPGYRSMESEDLAPQQTVISRSWEASVYPELAATNQLFDSFRLYRDWTFGRKSPVRQPSGVGVDTYLHDDASNLTNVLSGLLMEAATKDALVDYLNKLNEDVKDIQVVPLGYGNQVLYQVLLIREKDNMIPASRLSDGTLHWLALLAVLLNPARQTLVCFEEPEIGLHPDMIPQLAHLLRRAATRMQVVVTTHSELLVDQFTGTPEDVIVCEKSDGATTMRRLSSERLSNWLKEDYTLGQLWGMDITGGRR